VQLRVASFNVENLLGHDIRFYDRLIYTADEAGAKINWTAATLTRTRADIVGVQEVWFEDTLKEAVKRSFHFGEAAHVMAPGATLAENLNGRLAKRPRLGIISRYPIKSVEVFARFPATVDLTIPLRVDGGAITQIPIPIAQFQRPPLRAVVDIGGRDLIVYVAHLKSKGPMIRNGENGDEPFVGALGQARATIVRAAEAAALRHLILSDLQNSAKPTIVLGDLNDTPDAASTQTVRGPSPHPGMDQEEKRALWDVVLYSTFRIARERSPTIHTHIHEGERDILDHILVSEEFYARNKDRIGDVVRHEVINDHLRDDEREPKTPGSSDHGVPIAEIQLLTANANTNA
jgi:hypothetical protein